MRPGPQSASWRIHAERVVVLGWPRAILLQFAHPLVAAGVAAHSSFRTSRLAPLFRLHGTIRAMLALTFGDDDDARSAAARINAIHDRVNGTLPEPAGRLAEGTAYSARDPHLLAWVQMTLLDTLPRAYELLVGPLEPSQKDDYCLEGRRGARLLGIPDDLVPVTFDGVTQAVTRTLSDGSLIVTDTARSLARHILESALPPPASHVHRLITLGLLPAGLREAYGFKWSASDEAALQAWSRRLRRFSAHAPAVVRQWRAARVDGHVSRTVLS